MKSFADQSGGRRVHKRQLILLWFACGGFASVFFLFLCVVALKSPSVVGLAFSGFFSLLGVFLLWIALRTTLDYLRFGVVTLVQPQPACPGGSLKATLRFHDQAPPVAEIATELNCINVMLVRKLDGPGVDMLQKLEFTRRRTFPLRPKSLEHELHISFDIPANLPASTLPGERPGEPDWTNLRGDSGKPLEFHRWELGAVAKLHGVDFERSFPVIVEPGPQASGTAAAREVAGGSPRRPPHAANDNPIKMIVILSVVLLGNALPLLYVLFSPDFARPAPSATRPLPDNVAKQQMNSRNFSGPVTPDIGQPAPSAQAGDLPPRTAWTTGTAGWSMPLPEFARHLGIAANGIRSVRKDGVETISIDELVIEKNPAWSRTSLFELRISITYYPVDPAGEGTLGGFSTSLASVKGTLTDQEPVLRGRNLSITAILPEQPVGKAKLHIETNAVLAERKYAVEKSREYVMGGR